MWVILQGQFRMVEIVEEAEVCDNIIQSRVNNRWTKIGKYKTPERAKEVLAQMFRVLQAGGKAFQMPEE